MKERPIIFSTPMVKAILEGRKTQTRRVIKANDIHLVSDDVSFKEVNEDFVFTFKWKYAPKFDVDLSPIAKQGDILWVRETFSIYLNEYLFKSTNTIFKGVKWKPSIHMPKAVAQVWLKITDIRVERLQDISEEDAKEEGVEKHECEYINRKETSYRNGFFSLWVDINGSESLNKNPWVWVIEFKVISTAGKPATNNQ